MCFRRSVAFVILALASSAVSAEDAAIERAEQRGAALARYDRAASVATDDLLARLPPERRPEIGGWVVTPAAGSLHVEFFGKGSFADRAIYAADFDGKAIVRSTVFPANDILPLSAAALRQKHALELARTELAKHAE